MNRRRTAILISGRGSNMARLIEAAAERDYPAEIVGVVSDRAEAPGLVFAAGKGLKTAVVQRADHASREAYDAALDAALGDLGAEIVALAGYMRLISAPVVERWQGRMINIHPALLPAFRGLDTHRRALDAGVRIHGASVHFVTPELDAGPIIAQAAVPVLSGDTEETLAARVLKVEHELYPLALGLVASGAARMEDGRTVFAGLPADESEGRSRLFSPESWHGAVDLEALARFTP